MRLIDVKDCKDLLYVRCIGQDKAFIAAMEQVIDDCPTIDAVEVVRCKDCIYYFEEEDEPADCANRFGVDLPQPYGFCSYGKRRETDNV